MKGDRLDNILDEIKDVALAVKREHNGKVTRLSNKDMNLWIVTKFMDYEGRLAKVETRQKMLMWFVGISIAALSIYAKI